MDSALYDNERKVVGRDGACYLTNFKGNLSGVRRAWWHDAVSEQDILRFEVAVHDALGVDGAHRFRQLPKERPDGAFAEQPVRL